MASVGTIQVEIHGDTKQIRQELAELEMRAKVVSTKPGSRARAAALEEQTRYFTQRALEANRDFAAMLSWWNVRRWLASFRAWRYQRELAAS